MNSLSAWNQNLDSNIPDKVDEERCETLAAYA